MNANASRTDKTASLRASIVTNPAPSLPVVTAEGLEMLIRQLSAENVVEPASRPLPVSRTRQVRFGMD